VAFHRKRRGEGGGDARASRTHVINALERARFVIVSLFFFFFPFLFFSFFSFFTVRATSMYDVIKCVTIRSCTALISVFTIRVSFHRD